MSATIRQPIIIFILAFSLSACIPTSSSPAPTPTSTPTPTPTTEVITQADADIIFVRAVQQQDNLWTFHVTVQHPDTGWEDYADGWNVSLPDGTSIKPDNGSPFTRLLLHPHVDEQPFTRSQSNILIPPDVQFVTVSAHDLLHGFGGQSITVDFSLDSGPGFEVESIK